MKIYLPPHERAKQRKTAWIWFLLGLGTSLQIIASLSFTELFAIVAAPIIFMRQQVLIRRHGLMGLVGMTFLVFVACIVSIIMNQTRWLFALRGLATTFLMPCSIIVAHWILNKDLGGFKWFLLGLAFSNVLSTFVFQHSFEMDALARGAAGKSAVEGIMAGPLYWITRLQPFVLLIPKGWYLQCPTAVCVALPLGFAAFAMLTTVSGRSTALGALGACVLVILGGKSRSSIKRRVCNNFGILALVSVLLVVAFHGIYRYSASSGLLGENAAKKYEHQTKGSSSIMKLLMGGRMDSFCGLLACKDKPIVGFGPWPMDRWGYVEEFLAKYADAEDYEEYIKEKQFYDSLGRPTLNLILAHSHIVGFWVMYGICGLSFWLYAVFIAIRYLKSDCFSVPQLFMWIAGGIPMFLWNVFFSPFSDRFGIMLFLSACLMVRAVRKGTMRLPERMQLELVKYER